ncbi:MAG: hypothetical protein HC828_04870 [Blastochloris sp.]|nr:hypothetical protein [Blastochloris sp.]
MKVFMIVMMIVGSFTVSSTQEVRASLHSQLVIGEGPLPDGYYTESAYVNIHNESGNAMAGMAFRLRFDRDVRISHASIFCQDGVHRNMLQSKVYYSLFDSKMYQISLAPMPPRSSVACHITFRYPIAHMWIGTTSTVISTITGCRFSR